MQHFLYFVMEPFLDLARLVKKRLQLPLNNLIKFLESKKFYLQKFYQTFLYSSFLRKYHRGGEITPAYGVSLQISMLLTEG